MALIRHFDGRKFARRHLDASTTDRRRKKSRKRKEENALKLFYFFCNKNKKMKWKNILHSRHGIVVIASAYRTEDPGFESRQGVRFLGIYTVQCCCHNLISIISIIIVCMYLNEKNKDLKKRKKERISCTGRVVYICSGIHCPRSLWVVRSNPPTGYGSSS
jgi:hypothetical protein